MLPNLWIFDTYTICIMVGVIACLTLCYFYLKKHQYEEKYFYDIAFIAILTIIFGILSATIFQTTFDLLKQDSTNPLFAMTFFGGLAGGVVAFILLYRFYIKKRYPKISIMETILPIAPACITIAHAFGRIGCFCAGCCYGVETDSIFGVLFPGHKNPVYPTQLFEAGFLFLLTIPLYLLAYFKKTKYTMSIYLACYGIFRFSLEFLRGDERGVFFLGLSPSQCFSIIAFISSVILCIYLLKFYNRVEK